MLSKDFDGECFPLASGVDSHPSSAPEAPCLSWFQLSPVSAGGDKSQNSPSTLRHSVSGSHDYI